MVPSKFKKICVACATEAGDINKEHFWPQWLIERTRTYKTGVVFGPNKRINPRKMVVPLCVKCNSDFGRELEGPVSRLFWDIEAGQGLSDFEAELLIRWLWKFEGLAWSFENPSGMYTVRYTLRERVLHPIDHFRANLSLAMSLARVINPKYGDAPMGIDSWNNENAVFVAGVFSRVAIMVLDRQFDAEVPPQFSIYHLSDQEAPDRAAKLFYPKIGFTDCEEAVFVTKLAADPLSYAHDLVARNSAAQLQRR